MLAWQVLLFTEPSFCPFAIVLEALNELAAQYFSSVVCLASPLGSTSLTYPHAGGTDVSFQDLKKKIFLI